MNSVHKILEFDLVIIELNTNDANILSKQTHASQTIYELRFEFENEGPVELELEPKFLIKFELKPNSV